MGERYRACIVSRLAATMMVVLMLFVAMAAYATEEEGPLQTPRGRLGYLPNQVLVTLKSGRTDADMEAIKTAVGGVSIQKLQLANTYKLILPDMPGKVPVDEFLGQIQSNPAVSIAERNILYYPSAIPDDPLYPVEDDPLGYSYFSGQWHLQPTIDEAGLHEHILAQQAWDLEKGQEDVVVAVIDTGTRTSPKYEDGIALRYPHPDLGRYMRVPNEELGAIDWFRRFDYVLDPLYNRLLSGISFTYDYDERLDPAPSDVPEDAGFSGHGTNVAGVIAAKTDNSNGVAGLCWNDVWVLPLRVFPDDVGGGAPTDCIVEAILYCISYKNTYSVPGETLKVDVINMSLGSQYPSAIMRSACNQAARMGIVVVAAAGNDWDYGPYPPGYPGAYDEVICVSATAEDDLITPWSQRGHAVDIAAPGANILTTDWSLGMVDEDAIKEYNEAPEDPGDGGGTTPPPVPGQALATNEPSAVDPDRPVWADGYDIWGNGYQYVDGTSFSSPVVAAAAALLISKGVPGEDVKDILCETATPIGLGHPNDSYGWGLVNVYEALKMACIDVDIESPTHGGVMRTNRPKFRIDLRNARKETIKVWLNPVDDNQDGIPDNEPIISGDDPDFDQKYYVLDEEAGKSYLLFDLDLNSGNYTIRARAETKLTFDVPPSVPLTDDELAQFTVAPRTLNSGWHLFSLPFGVDPDSVPSDILPCQGILARWHYANSAAGEYGIFSLDGSRADWEASFVPPSVMAQQLVHPLNQAYEATPPAGLGYWLYVSEPINFPDLSGESMDTAPYEISLYNGWNMVGNPFPFAVNWATSVVEYAGMRVPISEAVANGWISDFVFRYDSVYRRYNWRRIGQAIFQPWEAEWVQVRVSSPYGYPEPDVKLIIPPSPYTGVLR